MTARSQMWMRCSLERNVETSDGGGGTTQSWVSSYTDLACVWWAEAGDERVIGGQVVRRNMDRLLVPLNTGVTARDRVSGVRDRLGNRIADGPMVIDSVNRRRDHLELRLEARTTNG